jgi:sugar-specific transcriptional regulator TrmB
MDQIKSFLHQLSLSESEADLYLTLLSQGPLSISQLSKKTKRPRTTTHENTAKLIQKGLIAKTVKGSFKKLSAEPPVKLEMLLTDRKVKLNHQQESLSQLEDKLPAFIKRLYHRAKDENTASDIQVKIVEGRKNIFEMIYMDSFQAETVYSYSNIEKYYEIYPGTRDLWLESYRKNPNRNFFDITIDLPEVYENIQYDCPEALQYHYRLLPKSNTFFKSMFTDYLIYDGKVTLVELNPKKVQGIIIESSIIYESMKILQNSMWDLLPAIPRIRLAKSKRAYQTRN